MKTIEITDAKEKRITVPAAVFGPVAIHRQVVNIQAGAPVFENPTTAFPVWQVTHIATGKRLTNYPLRCWEARKLVRVILKQFSAERPVWSVATAKDLRNDPDLIPLGRLVARTVDGFDA